MAVARSVRWDDAKKRRRLVVVLAFVVLILPLSTATGRSDHPATTVILQALPGRLDDARQTVVAVGGTVTDELPLIEGLAASVPADALGRLRRAPAIWSVTPDAAVGLQ